MQCMYGFEFVYCCNNKIITMEKERDREGKTETEEIKQEYRV